MGAILTFVRVIRWPGKVNPAYGLWKTYPNPVFRCSEHSAIACPG
jgi:hypothetical protein